MTKKQLYSSIEKMFEKMLPSFVGSWSDPRHLKEFSYTTYRSGDYGVIEIRGENLIKLTYSNKEINISQVLGKELTLRDLHDVIEKIFKKMFSFESLSSEEQETIRKIRENKESIKKLKDEIIILETHLNKVKTLKK